MDRKRSQLRSQHWVTKTILTVISGGARSVALFEYDGVDVYRRILIVSANLLDARPRNDYDSF